MFFRKISYLFFLIFFSSCQFFTTDITKNTQKLDSIVDFSKVDVSPSFTKCDAFIDKQEKTNCFRVTIHKMVAANLGKHKIEIHHSISETILVNLVIDVQGNIILKSIESSKNIKKEIPILDSILQLSLEKLPKLHPAIKRGIPVTTQYQLPILIQSDK